MNDDDEIVGIVATKYTEAARVNNEYNGRTKIEGFALPLDDDDKVDYDKLTVTGAVDSLEDIEEDDVIVLFAGAGQKTTNADTEKLVIQVVRDTVEGKITKTNSDGQFYINDKYYSKSQFADYPFVVGEEGTYFLDHKGQLVDFEELDSNEPKDYAVITEVLNGSYNTTAGRIALDAEITLVNNSGDEVTYKFDDKAKVGTEYVFDKRGTDLTVVNDDDDLKVNAALDANDVIKYSLNSKGKISKITMVKDNPDTSPAAKTDITGKSYVFASNVVVFNLDGTDVEVVDVNDLGEKVFIITSKTNKNGEIEMLFVKGLGASDTYAFITSAGTAWNDDDVIVQSLTAYVKGVEVFYETEFDTKASNYDTVKVPSHLIDKAKIVKLDLDGDTVTGATTQSAIDAGKVTRVRDGRIELNGVWYTLADDVAVYILDDGEFDVVGDASSVYYDAQVAVYAFDADNIADDVVEILFIFE
ncbi:hypothetical protein SDC9_88017 [bioreactor metagenome]|uniref:Uncharacterized protein n=2 Tax=root TaxID=1 RepID=A0A644ZKF3_9ZZZZ